MKVVKVRLARNGGTRTLVVAHVVSWSTVQLRLVGNDPPVTAVRVHMSDGRHYDLAASIEKIEDAFNVGSMEMI